MYVYLFSPPEGYSASDMMVRETMMLLCVCTLALPGQCHRFHTARIDDFGESVTLDCTYRDDVTFDYWIFPDLRTIVEGPYNHHHVELMTNNSIYISSVERENLGDYICRVRDNVTGEPLYYKTLLYLYIPSLWETYRHNVIVGCSAAAVSLILFTGICMIDRCRYSVRQRSKTQQEDQYKEEVALEMGSSQGAVNNGYEVGKYLAPDGSLVISTADLKL